MKHILDKFDLPYEYIQFENISIGVLLNKSDNYNFIQYINGLNVYNGGKPIEWVENNLISSFISLLPKKYDKIKNGDVKNKITLVVIFKNMKNPRFEDQVKSKCINSASMFKDITTDVDFSKLAKLMFKNKDIKNNILEFFDMKADWEAKKALKDLNKPVKKIRIEKYKPAINENKYLLLAEGLSAGNSVLSATGRDNIGLYPLKGKMLNCLKSTPSALVKNQEIKDLIDILNLNLTKEEPISYENIIITTDADLDGAQICSLALTLFVTYRPDLIKEGRIKLFRTPIVISYKKDTIQDFIFTLDELKEHQSKNKNCSYSYKKGLASVDVTEWEVMLKNGIEPYLETLEWSDDLPELFDSWMGSDPNKRKEMLEGSSFNLYLI